MNYLFRSMIGNYLGPDEAYRFARGEIVRASAGTRARLVRSDRVRG